MKKNFNLTATNKTPERQVDSVKHEIKKYISREQKKAVPAGTDFWDFDCKFGVAEENAEVVHLSTLIAHIDDISKNAGSQLYVEIIAIPKKRKPRQPIPEEGSDPLSPPSNQTDNDTGSATK